jgi:outer membrane autotransporter protein
MNQVFRARRTQQHHRFDPIGLPLAGCTAALILCGLITPPAQAACSATNATVTQCDSTAITITPNTGSSSVTVDGVSSVGIYYAPPPNTSGQTYTQTLNVTGATALSSTAGQSNVNGGIGITLGTSSATNNDGNTVNSTINLGQGVTINSHVQYGAAVFAHNDGAGDVSINSAATVTSLGVDSSNNPTSGGYGLSASTNLGAATVVNSGSVTATNGRGLYADGNSRAVTVDGSYNITATTGPQVTVSVENTSTGRVEAYQAAIRVINYYGLAQASNAGTAHSTTAQALVAWSQAGNTTISNSGTATTDDNNAIVAFTERGNATISNSGTSTAGKLVSGSAGTAGFSAMRAAVDYVGDIAITNTAGATATANSDVAIVAHTPQGNASVTNAGVVSGKAGIAMTSGAGLGNDSINDTSASASNTLNGNASLSNSGTISGVDYGAYLDSSANNISNSGTIRSQGKSLILGGGASTIANTGTIAGDIQNTAAATLTISGASGSSFGVLTGYNDSIGSISSTAGDVILSSGNLLLNDHINAGTRTVNNSGSQLQVNNRLTITGNYAQAAGAGLILGVANGATTNGTSSDSGYGSLRVDGATTLTAGTTISLKKLDSAYSFARGQRYVAISTSGSTNYDPASLNYVASGFNVSGANVIDDSGRTALVLSLGNAFNPATTSNAQSAFNGLINYNGANVRLLNVLNAALALGSTAQANKAGAQLSPAAGTVAANQAASAATNKIVDVVSAHVDGLRLAQSENGAGIATGESANNWAWWGQGLAGSAQQSMRDNVSGFRASYSGLLMGLDRGVGDRWRIGALASYVSNSVMGRDDNSGSSSHVDSYGAMAYAGYTADHWYTDASIGIIKHHYDTARVIDFTGFSGVANGRFQGLQNVVSLEAGLPIRLDQMWSRTTLTPIGKISYSNLRQDAYTETGGNGAALRVDGLSANSLKSEVGLKLERVFNTSYGDLSPAIQIGWRHEYRSNALSTISSFADDTTGTSTFVSSGASPLRDTGVLALSATVVNRQNLTITARYTMEAARGYTAQTGDLRLRYQF